MKKAVIFSGVFLITLTIGYFAVPKFIERITKPQTLALVEEKPLITETVQTPKSQQIDEAEDYSDEDFDENFKIKLAETGGVFHGGDVEAKSGETWLGLFKEGNNYFLRKTKLKVSRVHDELFDMENWQKTGKFIRVKEKQKNIFLLKNAKQLREGKVETLFQGLKYKDTWDADLPSEQLMTVLNLSFSKKFQIQDKVYELKVEGLDLVLKGDGKRQRLTGRYDSYEWGDLGNLFWVGDLDHDHKPDFYISFHPYREVLFLSSAADNDKLVKKVAMFVISGCGR